MTQKHKGEHGKKDHKCSFEGKEERTSMDHTDFEATNKLGFVFIFFFLFLTFTITSIIALYNDKWLLGFISLFISNTYLFTLIRIVFKDRND